MGPKKKQDWLATIDDLHLLGPVDDCRVTYPQDDHHHSQNRYLYSRFLHGLIKGPDGAMSLSISLIVTTNVKTAESRACVLAGLVLFRHPFEFPPRPVLGSRGRPSPRRGVAAADPPRPVWSVRARQFCRP